eukprot:c18042_g1_i1.p1 GENE.c18042_g1_i1~~c18042_g1_i1.p1  ORF type:complete len:303 (+),score=82.90 c18042_g1_i1:23-931(+)
MSGSTAEPVLDEASFIAEFAESFKGAVVHSRLQSRVSAKVDLLGTVHVSSRSAEGVRQFILATKPTCVVLELCQNRVALLSPAYRQPRPPLTTKEFIDIYKKQGQSGLAAAILSEYCRDIASKLNVELGSEFIAAHEAATVVGSRIVLGDRNVQVTLARCVAALTTWDKIRFVAEMIWDTITFDAKSMETEISRIMTNIEGELASMCPNLQRPLVQERDEFLAYVTRAQPDSHIVAVVGAGHVEGMRRVWDKDIDITALMAMPKPKRGIPWFRVAFRALVLYGVYRIGKAVYARRGGRDGHF